MSFLITTVTFPAKKSIIGSHTNTKLIYNVTLVQGLKTEIGGKNDQVILWPSVRALRWHKWRANHSQKIWFWFCCTDVDKSV